jgi:gluconolactonase
MDHVVWDRRFGDLVDGASLRQVGDGFGFPEGPVMLPDGYLVFSDIAADALVRFTRPGRTGIFRQPSGGANGNTLDPRGRLVTCEAGRRRVTRTEPDGAITVLAAHHEGKRLNAPNDIVVRSDGTVYFTELNAHHLLAIEGMTQARCTGSPPIAGRATSASCRPCSRKQ